MNRPGPSGIDVKSVVDPVPTFLSLPFSGVQAQGTL